ncbi:hypothetical protein OGY62_14915 [Citrobacter sp. CK198]|uniref:hypothetical protein n=1 Tax=Citrobacter sp. CK198 TaxID=2985107 RepID=UPI002577A443|nr:hypothetical protein [Citrobacter sp. CK198]MDM2974072.1 hypothetical protein [Citrobacter sp. CK198]
MKNKGFSWHIGTQSFGYHHHQDFGYTIWAPLATINPRGQRGGMAYVPKNAVNGEYLYSHIDRQCSECYRIKSMPVNNRPPTILYNGVMAR